MPSDYHQPVLLEEVVEVLAPSPRKRFIDCTLGGGGHTRALLERGAEVLAIDQDQDAIKHARNWAAGHKAESRLTILPGNFRHLEALMAEAGFAGPVDGILADLGISSRHVDVAERGFSFRLEGPLDMRMDRSCPLTAARICNEAAEDELAEIFHALGEEPRARAIARAIVGRRTIQPLQNTSDLAELVQSVVARHGPKHPATRVFQALRLAVNDELGAVESLLDAAPRLLVRGGRFAVISFHSLEDRIVKHRFRAACASHTDRPEWPAARANPHHYYTALTRRGVTPGPQEVANNPRARSATLRAVERI